MSTARCIPSACWTLAIVAILWAQGTVGPPVCAQDAPGRYGVAGDTPAAVAPGAPTSLVPPAPAPRSRLALPERLTLQDAFRLALAANKDVRVAWLDADVAEARVMGAKGEFDPTLFAEASRGRVNAPEAGVPVTRSEDVVGAGTGGVRQRLVTGTELEVSVSSEYTRDLTKTEPLNPQHAPAAVGLLRQDLLRNFGPAVNRTRIAVAQNNWQISQEELRARVVENLFGVEDAYWSLYFAMADLGVREAQLERAQKLVARAEAQVRAGEAAPIEITRAQSSAAAQAVSILDARNQVGKLQRRLLRLMGVLDVHLVEQELVLADAPPEDVYQTSLAEAWQTALRRRADLTQADLALANAQLQKSYAGNQRLPKLQAFGEYGLTGLSDEFSDAADEAEEGRYNNWEAGVVFEWPFPNRTARSDYAVAKLERRTAKVRRQAVVEQITRDVADALEDLQAAEGRITSARQSRDLAEQLLRSEEKSFSLGRSDSRDVLNAQSAVAEAERDEVRARTDYATALANLFRVQGDFLERKGIVLVAPKPR